MQVPIIVVLSGLSLLLFNSGENAQTAGLPAVTRMDCLLISNAQIALHQTSKPAAASAAQLSAANFGHEIEKGSDYVLALRRYDDDGSGVDSAHFSKTTLQLDAAKLDIALNQTVRISVSGGYYTEGGVGFIHRGEYWRAHEPIAQIDLARTKSGLTAMVEGTFVAVHALDSTRKDVALELTCPVQIISVDELGLWEGRVGADWGSFAPSSPRQ